MANACKNKTFVFMSTLSRCLDRANKLWKMRIYLTLALPLLALAVWVEGARNQEARNRLLNVFNVVT